MLKAIDLCINFNFWIIWTQPIWFKVLVGTRRCTPYDIRCFGLAWCFDLILFHSQPYCFSPRCFLESGLWIYRLQKNFSTQSFDGNSVKGWTIMMSNPGSGLFACCALLVLSLLPKNPYTRNKPINVRNFLFLGNLRCAYSWLLYLPICIFAAHLVSCHLLTL